MKKTLVVAVSCVALAACGGGGTSGGRSPVTTGDVQAFRGSAEAISTAATAYGATAATMPDHGACLADESGYETQVRPMVDQMRTRSGDMDEQMASMGRAADADMGCGASAMAAELDHHAPLACESATDMAPNRTEAARHVQAMGAWADHQRARSEQMGSMMGMSGMPGGSTTGTCQRNADGSYTLSGGGGGMMP